MSNVRHPISLVAYSSSDYDGRKWWTTWFPDEEMRPAPELGQEIAAFQSQLLALPEFKTLWAMERMCRLHAQPTSVRTNLTCTRKQSLSSPLPRHNSSITLLCYVLCRNDILNKISL